MKSNKSLIINLYLVIVFLALIISTEWRRRAGEHADYSYLVLLPFLIGMILRKQWGFIGSMVLGVLSSGMVVVIALTSIFIQERTAEMLSLGPIFLESPTSLMLIAFACAYLLFIGFPLIYAGKQPKAEQGGPGYPPQGVGSPDP